MGRCVVCGNDSDKRRDIMYHRFPKDEALRQTWVQNMGITRELSKSSVICSIHFAEKCFRSTMHTHKPALIRGSIPTIMTEEELLEQETIEDDNSSDSTNSNENDTPQQPCCRLEGFTITSSEYQNLEEFSPPRESLSDAENEKMMEELQYSCRKIKVKGVKWEVFRRLPETLKEMYWEEAQHIIEEQGRELKTLAAKNRRYATKVENLTLFTRSMKREIAKRARKYESEQL